ncbi:hypothetical protein [Nitrosomonas sp.]|uniref:hypothetical protein n=1 Tax=Nitrosomonas sp. TaxID=42353 RepID=UPI0037CBAA3D
MRLSIILETAVDAYQPLETTMDSELAAFAHADPVDETATHPITRLARRDEAAGHSLQRGATQPDSVPDAYSSTSNCGF